ncbi:tyrosine-protein kinase Shark-like [Ctenocephalides felis]|uniref:tyrosine-protein kinase Shark-like n=1 Tax=Ctenocephalides felis TaxID=7515 RepID=UPI000E6E32CC|nr:tyrosine-protein kinase Shark-like [Ctenocephalides felis]
MCELIEYYRVRTKAEVLEAIRKEDEAKTVVWETMRKEKEDKAAIVFESFLQGRWLFIDDGPYHESLEHLVEHYSLMSDGLPNMLQVAVSPKPKPPLPEFSTIPRMKSSSVKNIFPNKSNMESLSKSANVSLMNNETISLQSCTMTNDQDSFYTIPLNNAAVQIDNHLNMSTTYNDIENDVNKNIIRDESKQNNSFCKEIQNDLSIQRNSDISKESLVLGSVLGEGEFGEVYKGIYVINKTCQIDVAIKTLREEHVEANKEDFLREAKLMMSLDHHCIVRLIGVSQGPPLLMIQELVSLGSMLNYLLEFPERVNPKCELKIWAAQIACGMYYLETQKFVHRDLAARNILLSSKHQAKISDFGLSRALGTDNNYYQATQGGKWPIKW